MGNIDRRTWAQFKETGLLWWANRTLHLFGWAIVFDVEKETGKVVEVYPARVKFRGFVKELDDAGFIRLTTYMAHHSPELFHEVKD